jgi:IclR family acetate operon transcriptional repressor
MQNRPAYSIDSVDHALRVAILLKHEGAMRVMDVADRLGVARSTAHRLLATLVYRGFAEQDEQRRYVAGPVLRDTAVVEPVADLRRIALPHVRELATATDETASLVLTVGMRTRFVATVESGEVLRVGDREGRVLPAHRASGGKAVLARLQEGEVRGLCAETEGEEGGPVDVEALLRELRRCRRRGFAVNDQATESGVSAIGCAVPGGTGGLRPAVVCAMPSTRYRRDRVAGLVEHLTVAADRIGTEWADEWEARRAAPE